MFLRQEEFVMTERAEGAFTVTAWDESTCQELDGKAKLTRASMTFGYTGDLEATGKSEAVMFYREDGTAAYTGLEHMAGRLGGRSGSFVLRGDGAFENGAASTTWRIVDGSGSGDLHGISGTGSAVAASGQPGGTFTLDYDLG
jgi:Protein of unknown function (DUF3224)